jgi:hypothetical protein
MDVNKSLTLKFISLDVIVHALLLRHPYRKLIDEVGFSVAETRECLEEMKTRAQVKAVEMSKHRSNSRTPQINISIQTDDPDFTTENHPCSGTFGLGPVARVWPQGRKTLELQRFLFSRPALGQVPLTASFSVFLWYRRNGYDSTADAPS